jgi:hypothetical protein
VCVSKSNRCRRHSSRTSSSSSPPNPQPDAGASGTQKTCDVLICGSVWCFGTDTCMLRILYSKNLNIKIRSDIRQNHDRLCIPRAVASLRRHEDACVCVRVCVYMSVVWGGLLNLHKDTNIPSCRYAVVAFQGN